MTVEYKRDPECPGALTPLLRKQLQTIDPALPFVPIDGVLVEVRRAVVMRAGVQVPIRIRLNGDLKEVVYGRQRVKHLIEANKIRKRVLKALSEKIGAVIIKAEMRSIGQSKA